MVAGRWKRVDDRGTGKYTGDRSIFVGPCRSTYGVVVLFARSSLHIAVAIALAPVHKGNNHLAWARPLRSL